MRPKSFRNVLVIAMIVAVSASCSVLSDAQERVGEIQGTAQAVGTQVQSGRNLITTAQAVVTQVQGNELVQTAQAVATQQGPRLLATAQAFATDQGPALMETARVFATQQGPGFIETAQALAAEQGPGALQTAQAIATRAASTLGQEPDEIPLLEGQKENYITAENFVSYFTPANLGAVEDFYRNQMQAGGWNLAAERTVRGDNSVILIFRKPDRQANVVLSLSPIDNQTIVLITTREV